MATRSSSSIGAGTPSQAEKQALINLSDYMYYAYQGSAANAANLSLIKQNTGFVPLLHKNGTPYTSVINSDGLYAQAFVSGSPTGTITKSAQIVIAYEGTNLLAQSTQFTGGQLRDDTDIAAGTTAPSFKPSAAFAQTILGKVRAVGGHRSNVLVTGHSLGAAEAEYAAAKTGLGGITFAAPGIAGKAAAPADLTDYVDIGDPIGNYAQDNFWGKSVTLSSNINHYGNVIAETNTTPGHVNTTAAGALEFAALAYSNSTTAGDRAQYLGLGLLSTLQGNDITIYNPSTKTTTPINGLGDFHSLTQYASDTGTTLFIKDGTMTGDTSFFPSAGLPSSAGVSAAQVACFASGTRIRAERGEIAVEALEVGERVVTASGELRAVRWLGHRTIDCRRHPRPEEAMPICIAAHAFGDNRPARDLLVSPGHAVCVDVMGEVLIPAGALVNGTSIRQLARGTVTYWHVELDSHDIILAEELPTESYLEMGNRAFFAEEAVVSLTATPDSGTPGSVMFCRPYVAAGSIVDAVRAMLTAKAGSLSADREAARGMKRRVG